MARHFDYECDICSDFFDDDDRRPLIGSCGHTVCMTCVDNLRSLNGSPTTKCPVCNTSHAFKIKVVNFQLVEFMKRSKSEVEKDNSTSTTECSSKNEKNDKKLECSSCSMVTQESRMAVCETCGIGSKVLEVDKNGSTIICNQLKLKKVVLCGCCIFEKHKNHVTVGLLSVELDTLAKEFHDNCTASIEVKQSNNMGYWMQSAVDEICENLRKMSNKEDAKLVADSMIKIIQYTKPISAIIKACEEEYERRVKMSSLWLDVMSKFLTNENSSTYSSKWTEMRKVLEEVIDNLEENSEAVDGKQWDHILNLILHEKNHPLPRPPYSEASYSQYSHY
ncbi:unnamed protein product [Auanema sp. JU1783]|nr:unnamed protein product [Auanema sp. JU1783]